MNAREFAVLCDGPARAAKTRTLLEKAFLIGANKPRSRGLFLRKTRVSMSNTVLQTWEDHVLGSDHPMTYGAKRPNRPTYHFPNGSQIDVLGLDNPDRLMSSEYDWAMIFEATELTEDDYEKVTSRLTGNATGYRQVICDCNPSHAKHWLINRARRGHMRRIPFTLRDNPRWWSVKSNDWTEAGLALLEQLKQLTGVRHTRLVEGKWASAEGLVYDGWNEDVHLIDRFDIPSNWRRVRSIDFGFTNPFSCLWAAINNDGDIYIYREVYGTEKIVQDWAKEINALSVGENIDATVADHDAEDRATLDREGIITIPANKAVTPGIQNMQRRLVVRPNGRPRLFYMRDSLINPDPKLRARGRPLGFCDEIVAYQWQPPKDGKANKEDPVKLDDHSIDGARYLCMYIDDGQSAMIDTATPVFADYEDDWVKVGGDSWEDL